MSVEVATNQIQRGNAPWTRGICTARPRRRRAIQMQPHQRTQSQPSDCGFCAFYAGNRKVPLLQVSVFSSAQYHTRYTIAHVQKEGGFLRSGGIVSAIDLRFLLLRAGDVESNPGPECISCGQPTRQVPLSCTVESCDKVAHSQRVCSGIRGKGKKDLGRCPEHRETVDQPCDQCGSGCERKKPGDRGPRACVVAGCDKVCHRGQKCSKISRYDKYQDWTCRVHRGSPERSSPTNGEGGDQQEVPRPALKCGGCRALNGKKKTIAKHIIPIMCNRCGRAFHGGCTDLPRPVIERIREDPDCPDAHSWSCPQCQKKIVQQKEREMKLSFEEVVDEASAGADATSKQSLRVLQWNAEAISTKVTELADRLTSDDIDVCVIQESHLQEGRKTPFIEGYASVRADRIAAKHGGLLAYIKKSLVMEEIGSVAIEATEVSTFRVRLTRNKWVHISNVYIPPENSKGQDSIKLRTDAIRAMRSSLICGDFNDHTILWDEHVAQDARGEALADWVFDNNLSILNDGDSTRVN